MSENIISGLISGVLATLLIFVFRSVWIALIIPWFEERIYKDVRIEGNWFSFYPTGMDNRQEVISLVRHGHAITGTIICSNGPDTGEKYQVTGSFRNLLLPLSYESSDLTKTDRGTITLKSVHNGERLSGKLAYYRTLDDSINTTNIIWFRSRSDLEKYISDIEKNREKIEQLRIKAQSVDKELKEAEGVIEKSPAVVEKPDKTVEAAIGEQNG